MSEESLVQQAQKGDIVAFNHLVVQHQEMVFNVAYRIMGDPAVAEDVTQETFITAYQSLGGFRGGSFKSWLIRVATNRCYDELRRRKRRPQTSLDEITDENESFAFLRSPADGPETHRQRVELTLVIERCLQGLPDDQRIVAVLGDVEGYDYQEIATITRVSLGTVKSRLSRARAKLRDCLQQTGGELLPPAYRLETRGHQAK
ncbi:MAG: sigma-70 family RNA polymerase sigma factor [Anaerolineae bacterium]|nr:sigma-70 family RNA polymerase sigma factor [Promineifilum sp.]MCZ2115782.1 sigma-70 family RNA polymerase sigma factor [Anaerolineae bacterium]